MTVPQRTRAAQASTVLRRLTAETRPSDSSPLIVGAGAQDTLVLRQLFANVELANSFVTANGFLVVPAVLCQSMVLDWGEGEREMLMPEALFDPIALRDWSAMVLTDEHPMEAVTSANARWYAVGHVGGDARQEGSQLACSLVFTDQYTIDLVRAGKRQLSIGAFFTRRFAPTKDYEFLVEKIVPNHVSLVRAGQCGEACAV